MPSRELGSAKQWNMDVYASHPAINWNFDNQGLCVLDNGDIWFFAERSQNFARNEETNLLTLCKVTPEGFTRYTADHHGLTTGNSPTVNFHPLRDEQYIYEQPMWFYTDPQWMITDGVKLFIWNPEPQIIYEFDPATLIMKRVVGTRAENYAQQASVEVNSHDGDSALIQELNYPIVYDGYAYFGQIKLPNPGSQTSYIRRIKLSEPYSVEAWAMTYEDPTNTSSGWQNEINTSTGLPNGLNGDMLFGAPKVGFFDGYVYYFDSSALFQTGGNATWAIKRAPIDDPSNATTLHYGLYATTNIAGDINYPPQTWDDSHVTADFPNPDVHWTGTFWDDREPFVGTTPFEGKHTGTSQYPGVMLSDGRWVMDNYAAGSFQSGYQQFGGEIIAWRLPEIVERWKQEGPFRHDGYAPMWNVICNASHMDETSTNYNFYVRDRGWNFRCGTKPLIPHPYAPGLAYNPNSPHGEKLFFPTGVVSYLTTYVGQTSPQTCFICVLEESSSSSVGIDVNLIFEGQALKGYSHPVVLESAFAQNQIILS